MMACQGRNLELAQQVFFEEGFSPVLLTDFLPAQP